MFVITPITQGHSIAPAPTYFTSRLSLLGITPQNARSHSLGEGPNGEIYIYNRNLQGEMIKCIPEFGQKRIDYKKATARKTQSEQDLSHLYESLRTIRHTPEQVNKGQPRYKIYSKAYTGYPPLANPNNLVLKIHQEKESPPPPIVVGIEGYFKALSLGLAGIPAFAFSGITTYKLDDILKDFLLKNKPKAFVMAYDGDALNLFGTHEKEDITSIRVQDFCNSASRFAKQFFKFCNKNDLKIQLHFAMLHPDLDQKGMDDLLQETDNQPEVIDAFRSLESSHYFHFFRLFKTKYKKVLEDFFSLNKYKKFYRTYQSQINAKPFKFHKATYQLNTLWPQSQLDLFKPIYPVHFFELHDNPFLVDIPAEIIPVQKYISEADEDLQQLLWQHNKLAINAPTGSGKTTYFIELAKKKGLKMVITVPTIALAQQLAKEHGITGIHGKISSYKKELALNSKIVVCTYDTLKHIDLEHRILIVDESHNLVNQYGEVLHRFMPFRAKTMRKVVKCFEKSKQTVLISGTTNKLLCKTFGFHYVEIHRQKSNQVHVHHLEAPKAKGQTHLLLQELSQLDFSSNKIHFVYYNSNQQLDIVAAYLAEHKILQAAEIEIITRDQINSGNNRVLKEIMSKSQTITSPVKLVLSTCIIAEGISLKNKNIGNVYTVNIRDLDSFRQYVARFRKMEHLHVYAITAPEKKLSHSFFIPATKEFDIRVQHAEIQVKQFEIQYQQFSDDFEKEDLAFFDDLKPIYDYQSKFFNWIYTDKKGAPQIDSLRILAAINERQRKTANNAYFFSQLLKFENFNLESSNVVCQDEKITAALELTKEDEKMYKEMALNNLKKSLNTRPDIVVTAYILRAKENKDRHAQKFVKVTASDLITDDIAAQQYLDEHRFLFEKKWFRKLIRDFMKMHFIGLDKDSIEIELEAYSAATFAQKWKIYNAMIDFILYSNRRHRLHLTTAHKIDIKAKALFKKRVLKAKEEGLLTTTLMTEICQEVFKLKTYNADTNELDSHQVVSISEQQVHQLMTELFMGTTTKKNGEVIYDIKGPFYENSPQELHSPFVHFYPEKVPDIFDNPLKMLQLRKNK